MATARPVSLRDPKEASEAARAAEAVWRLVVDAQRDDLTLLRRWWPDRASPEPAAALARLLRRAAPDGDADEAMGAVHAAYGGYDRVPQAVRRRLERYVQERMGALPWPERDFSEGTDEPALLRKQRRQRRTGGA
jgi:hypothetical protein